MPDVKPITFLVAGTEAPAGLAAATRGASPPADTAVYGTVKQSVLVTTQRGAAAPIAVSATPGEDLVVLHLDRGPELILHPANARDLLLAQQGTAAGDTRGAAGGGVQVPVQLQWRGLESGVPTRGAHRGWLGDVFLRAVEVVKGKVVDSAADFAASKIVARFDAQVNPGVYRLSPGQLEPLKNQTPVKLVPPSTGRTLVLIHGTFSTTSGTFGKLWTDHPGRVRTLFDTYGDSVFALDHPTLGDSPIANAVTLAEALPAGARLHLVTHSRGGLVAEVLARICANPKDVSAFAATKKDHQTQHEELRALAQMVAKKKIAVDRVVRVACPARGTTLASKRLDAYLSVFKWTLELAGVPVAPVLIEFLGEVARRRADPEELPGLAAQIPGSPLVQWLHSGEGQIDGDLRVVAGDMEGDSVISWLKTLLADAFYWTDNDLVVQTRSMYGGSPRRNGATFVLDQGGKVSHFSYFSNAVTAGAIVNALTADVPDGFRQIGPLSWAGTSATGTRAAVIRAAQSTPQRAAAFLLPGILGSNLGIAGKRIWLGWRVVNGFGRLQYSMNTADRVEPDGPIGLYYDDLAAYLSSTHEVIPFAFDWRRPIEDEAKRLADAVDAALTAREKSGQPVRVVAHSMGGIVTRTMELVRPKTWARMVSRDGGRVLMLGTPNGGSWAPMQVLTGDDTFGNLIVSVGAPFQSQETRNIVGGFPGLMQLQAGLLDRGLSARAEWQKLAEADLERLKRDSWWHNLGLQLDAHRWGIPTQATLDAAVALRKKLDAQLERAAQVFSDRVVMVTGRAPFTPDGFDATGDEGFVYLNAPEDGDGRVTLRSAMLPGVPAWRVDSSHGDLPRRLDAFAAYADLLLTGTTNRLPRVPQTSVSRGAAASAVVRSRPSRDRVAPRPPQRQEEVMMTFGAEPTTAAPSQTALRISVVHGDLTFIGEPLLLGHYKSTRLTGAERVMDGLVAGKMSDSLARGLYPVAPGSHQIFFNTRQRPDNPWQLPRPKAVIVAGLGEEGTLRAVDLVSTVRQAVIAWSHRLMEEGRAPELFSLATTLIGSGGVRMSVGESARLIAQGVREANERLATDGAKPWPQVDHVQMIELYLDRATEVWRSLQVLEDSAPGSYLVTDTIRQGSAGLPRVLDAGYRGADYDFISAVSDGTESPDGRVIYTIDTKRARSEVRAQTTQAPLIRQLVTSASNAASRDPQIGHTLFKLLVPVEIEPFLGGSTETVIELDSGTAGIPWELLNTEVPGSRTTAPWAVRTKLVRKLRTEKFRERVVDADAEAAVLVIGEPQCDDTTYPRLPAARKEAVAVVDLFSKSSGRGTFVKPVISEANAPGADAQTVLDAVLERDWRIVHVSGHGEPPLSPKEPRGVVLSGDLFLGPHEIEAMRVVPELVFVNCCHLAARDIAQLLDPGARFAPYDRAKFAAGVAESLIGIGVKCVIAAGWAVEDEAAQTFATTFYRALLNGERFIDAVGRAREETWRQHRGNTWAAYQCYGDPDWFYRSGVSDAQRPPTPLRDQFAAIGSADALVLALQTIAVRSKFDSYTDEKRRAASRIVQRDRLTYLETHFGSTWGHGGAAAAAFGLAWSEIGDRTTAVEWLERARDAADGAAPMAAIEQLASLQSRAAWEQVERDLEEASVTAAAADKALDGITRSTKLLDQLIAVGSTVERASLYGAASKRRALIHAAVGRKEEEQEALREMVAHYRRAEDIARASGAPDMFYPAMNRLAGELALGESSGTPEQIDAIQSSLAKKVESDPDFWSVVGQTELKVYEALLERKLADALEEITREFRLHHVRVGSPRMWSSVYDNAVFVLAKYALRATAGEQAAAQTLLTTLRGLARPDERRPGAKAQRRPKLVKRRGKKVARGG